MPRTKMIDGVIIPLTQEEETARDAEEWKASMEKTDESMPRHMEDLITSNASLVIPAEMKKRYDEKIKVRGERP